MNQGTSVWSEEVTAYLLLLPRKMSYAKKTKALNERFGLELTLNAVIGKCDRARLGGQRRAVPAVGCGDTSPSSARRGVAPPTEGPCDHGSGEVQSRLPTIERKNVPPRPRGFRSLPIASLNQAGPGEEAGPANPADAAAMARQAARQAARHYSQIHPDDLARVAGGVSFDDLTSQNCHFPIGEVGKPGFAFCGAVADLPPYCLAHAKRCFHLHPTPARRDDSERAR